MKITVQSTTKIVELNGVPARVWEGMTENGTQVHCFITRIACHCEADATEFERDLQEHRAPVNPDVQAYPMRLIL